MPNEENSKSTDNPLTEVAKAIGSSLGNAANRASEMLRDVIPASLAKKASTGNAKPKAAPGRTKSKPKLQLQKKAATRKNRSKPRTTKKAAAVRKSASGKRASLRTKKK